MGYFCNGTHGEIYNYQFCQKCLNWRESKEYDGAGCPVWDLHLFYNRDDKAEAYLNHFIPEGDFDGNGECKMFIERGDNGKRL